MPDAPRQHPTLAQVLVPAVGLVALLLLVAVVASPGSFLVRVAPVVDDAGAPATPDAPAPPVGLPAPPRDDPVPQQAERAGSDAVTSAFEDLLELRDEAVATGDADDWTSTTAEEVLGRESFTALSGLPLTRFESSLVPGTLLAGDVGDVGDAGAWSARVETVFELAGGPVVERTDTVTLAPVTSEPVTSAPVTSAPVTSARVTLAPTVSGGVSPGADSTWQVRSWTPYPEQGELGTAAPWDLGPVHASVTERAVVLSWVAPEGTPADAATWGAQVGGWADAGAVTVDSYLGTAWPRVSLLLVPATVEQFVALVPGPRPAVDDVYAAVTTDVDTPDDGGGDLVVLNPTARSELVAETWQVTVTHELVHVASGARFGDEQEAWLAEGFADLVGWSALVPATVEREVVAARLLERVATGAVDASALPAAQQFGDPDPDVVGDAYEGSWLAALLLEDELGTEGLISLYTAASQGTDDARGRVDAALLAATGQGRDAFEARWGAFVVDLATS